MGVQRGEGTARRPLGTWKRTRQTRENEKDGAAARAPTEARPAGGHCGNKGRTSGTAARARARPQRAGRGRAGPREVGRCQGGASGQPG